MNKLLLVSLFLFISCQCPTCKKDEPPKLDTVYFTYTNSTNNGDCYIYVDGDLKTVMLAKLGTTHDTMQLVDKGKISAEFVNMRILAVEKDTATVVPDLRMEVGF
jgi:hypothetical protein